MRVCVRETGNISHPVVLDVVATHDIEVSAVRSHTLRLGAWRGLERVRECVCVKEKT